MAPPIQQTSSQLPPRENAIFKRIVKCYEHKQYKSALRYAKQILSNAKYAEHGETLAMKGLILNCLGKKSEAYDYVRRGLKNDVRSHVCWHVYGLLQRADKKYDEAIKAYRNALKIDKENLQILRDLSLLQLQMRDLDGYKETRYQLFVLRSTQRASWIGYAMAYHLLEEFDMAIKILEEFRKTQNPKSYDYEHSELLLYQNMVYREAGKYDEAFEHLRLYGEQICDKVTLMEMKALLLAKLGKSTDAADIYRQLIDRNPDNILYYRRLEDCSSLAQAANYEHRLAFYEEMARKYQRSLAPYRIPLTFVTGPKYYELVSMYAKKMLRKGVPPLFSILRCCYTDQNKIIILENLMLSFADCLEKNHRFPGEEEEEAPTTVLWTYYYLALHYDYLGQLEKALFYINRAITHTPTLIELFCAKAKIFKHAGNMAEAVRWMDDAQSLDTADRYINSKCAKYLIRAGMISEAEAMCAKFTRVKENILVQDSLNEMQCMWFQTECARTYRKRDDLGEALKKCHEVDRHFTDIVEDQFDFHTYCIRRMTLCAYVSLLRLEDILRKHRFYFRAAKCAIKIYLRLHDRPYDENAGLDRAKNANAITGEMRKQMRKKKKEAAKQEQKRQNQQQPTQQQQQQKATKDHDPDEPQREPLDPDVLVKVEKPLDEAVRFLKPLIILNSDEMEAYLLGFEVFYRKGKVLLMLLCLKRATALSPSSPRLHVCIIKFLNFAKKNTFSGVVDEILTEDVNALFATTVKDVDLPSMNDTYLRSHTNSLPHIVAVAEAMYVLDSSTQSKAVQMATSLNDTLDNRTWKTCRRVLKILSNGHFGSVSESVINEYKASCHELFPHASIFSSTPVSVSINHEPVFGNDHNNTATDDVEE